MNAFIWIIDTIISLYINFIIADVALALLVQFNIVNAYQPFVAMLRNFFHRVTEPALAPIRRIMPDFGLDLSPLVLILALEFTRRFILELAFS